MAEILAEEEFYEGAVFHAYHAFEAICCAGLGELSDSVESRTTLLLISHQKHDIIINMN